MTAPPAADVYRPQHDSRLLIAALSEAGPLRGRRVADLCAGSGVIGFAAAKLGAASVTAFELSPAAVSLARAHAAAAAIPVEVRLGCWTRALDCRPFDVVACNPPYVPIASATAPSELPADAGPICSWHGGHDGRRVLDPLCRAAPELLAAGGTLLVVQSEYAGVGQTIRRLAEAGLRARVVAAERIPYGPVLSSQARDWEASGRIGVGCRSERIAVIRADKP